MEKRLLSDDEWAQLMAQTYEEQGSPVDAVAKSRVWRLLGKETPTSRRSQTIAWTVAAAGILAALGVTQVFQKPETWREKGETQLLPVVLTPYMLEQNGATTPVQGERVPPGVSIVFRARSTQSVFYALLIAENDQAPRIAIEDGPLTPGDEQLMMKQGHVYGETMDQGSHLKACLVASSTMDSLQIKLQDLNHLMATLPPQSCASLQAGSP